MGDVLSFKKNKSTPTKKGKPTASRTKVSKTATPKKQADSTPQRLPLRPRATKKKETMNAESIKLWWISQEFDELIRKAVLDKHIPVEELAAVMAHRLGNLLLVSERTPELTLFCMKIISRITNQSMSGSNAS